VSIQAAGWNFFCFWYSRKWIRLEWAMDGLAWERARHMRMKSVKHNIFNIVAMVDGSQPNPNSNTDNK
jgi:hypothetical protein